MKSENYLYTCKMDVFIIFGETLYPSVIFPTFLLNYFERNNVSQKLSHFENINKRLTYIEFLKSSEVVISKSPFPTKGYEDYHPSMSIYIGDVHVGSIVLYELTVPQLMRLALKATAFGYKVEL